MTKYLLTAAWVALSYPIYRWSPVAACVYGFLSTLGLIILGRYTQEVSKR